MSDEHHLCSNCGDVAKSRCASCATFYCKKTCQVTDWSDHKLVCGKTIDERTIFRACILFRKAYLAWREQTFDQIIHKIEELDRFLIIHAHQVFSGVEKLQDFPVNITNKKHKAMILTLHMCDEPAAFFMHFLLDLLQGIEVNISEAGVVIKPQKLTALRCNINGQVDDPDEQIQHNVILIEVPSLEKTYVLDATGAQLGIFTPCTEKSEYWKQYVKEGVGITPLFTHKKLYEAIARTKGPQGSIARRTQMLITFFQEGIILWKYKLKVPIPEFLHQPDHIFKQNEDTMLKEIKKCVKKFVDKLKKDHSEKVDKPIEAKIAEFNDKIRMEEEAMKESNEVVDKLRQEIILPAWQPLE